MSGVAVNVDNKNFIPDAGTEPAVGKKKQNEFTPPKVSKDESLTFKRVEARKIKGALESTTTVEGFHLNEATTETLKDVLTREYQFCEKIIKQNANELMPIIAKFKLNQPLTPNELNVVMRYTRAGFGVDKFMFYIDFTSGVAKFKDVTAIKEHAGDYLNNREDRLEGAMEIATEQMKALQEAAHADYADIQINPEAEEYSPNMIIFNGQGRPVDIRELNQKTTWLKRQLQKIYRALPPTVYRATNKNELPMVDYMSDVNQRDATANANKKMGHNIYYSGVQFLKADAGFPEPISPTVGNVRLDTSNRYKSSLLGVDVGSFAQLQGKTEFEAYANRITDLANARIDYYVANGMERSKVRPKVYEIWLNPATKQLEVRRTKDQQEAFTDIETSGLTIDEQKVELQRKASRNTKEKLKELEEQAKKTANNEWLEQHVKQWKVELGENTPQNKEKIEKDKKDKQDEIDRANKKKETSQKKERIEAKLAETNQQLTEIEKSTGLTRVEVEEFDKKNSEIGNRNQLISEENQLIEHWQNQLRGIPPIPTIPIVDKNTGNITNPQDRNSIEYLLSFDLQKEIENAQGKVLGYKLNIIQFEKDKKTIVKNHQGQGLTDELMESAYSAWKQNEQASKDKSGLTNLVGGNNADYDAIPTVESVRKEIETLQEQQTNVGQDRIETRVSNMLDKFEEMRKDETARNTRLQQHEKGDPALTGIPDYAHLAGYPRVYLRTIQILFPNVSFNPDQEQNLKAFMRLFPMEDFVRLAGPRMGIAADMYSQDWHTLEQNLMFQIDDELANAIVDDLAYRIKRKTLGLTDEDRQIFDINQKIRNEYQAHLFTDVEKDELRTIINPNIAAYAERFYYYDSVEDLARRFIEFSYILPPYTPDQMKKAYFIAEEIIQYRKEHPNI